MRSRPSWFFAVWVGSRKPRPIKYSLFEWVSHCCLLQFVSVYRQARSGQEVKRLCPKVSPGLPFMQWWSSSVTTIERRPRLDDDVKRAWFNLIDDSRLVSGRLCRLVKARPATASEWRRPLRVVFLPNRRWRPHVKRRAFAESFNR